MIEKKEIMEPKTPSRKIRLSIYMDYDKYIQLIDIKNNTNRSLSDVVRIMMDKYLGGEN